MTQELRGKVAIVTGASRGIGAAIAKRLAAEGASIALVARTVEPGTSRLAGSMTEVAEWIRTRGGECICISAHLGKEEQRDKVVPETIDRFGAVDILINNAAWCRYQPSHEQSVKDIHQTFEINVVAPLRLATQCLPSMKERGAGWVVNISSETVKFPSSAPYDMSDRYTNFHLKHCPSIYAASKVALNRLSAGMAIELAQFNIAVNTVAPVEAVATEGASDLGVIDAAARMEPVEAMAEAALELSRCSASEVSGRVLLSLDLLRDLGRHSVKTLDGRQILPNFSL